MTDGRSTLGSVTVLGCGMCSSPMEVGSASFQPCGHIFHDECFYRWEQEDEVPCPTCREEGFAVKAFHSTTAPLHDFVDVLADVPLLNCRIRTLEEDLKKSRDIESSLRDDLDAANSKIDALEELMEGQRSVESLLLETKKEVLDEISKVSNSNSRRLPIASESKTSQKLEVKHEIKSEPRAETEEKLTGKKRKRRMSCKWKARETNIKIK